MKPRYFQISLGWRIDPPIGERLRGRGLKKLWDLEKWKISDFPCLITRPYCLSRDNIIL